MARNWEPFKRSTIINISVSLASSCLVSQVFAAGFQLSEQNVTNLGLAYSGTAALAEDVSTNFFNAAGLTRIGESQIVVSGVAIQGDFDFTATSATSSVGTPVVAGSNNDDPAELVGVPAFHIAKRLDPRWVFGFSVSAPYGLVSEYSDTGIARYTATNTSLETINLSPSLAYQVVRCFSVGFGVDATYGKAQLDTNTGFGVVDLDGFQKNQVTGWGYGYHAGVLWEPLETTRIGLNYRSYVDLHMEGYSESLVPGFTTSPSSLYAFNYSLTNIVTSVNLPETATLSVFHQLLPAWAITADIAWTNWSRFHTLRLRHQPPVGPPNPLAPVADSSLFSPDLDLDVNFKDSRRYALGAIFNYDPNWTFRMGVAFDESAVRDDFRTARIPDSDRYWIALGGAYAFSQNLQIDFGYAHLFFEDASLDDRGPFFSDTNVNVTAARLVGSYESSVNLFGLQFRYDFV